MHARHTRSMHTRCTHTHARCTLDAFTHTRHTLDAHTYSILLHALTQHAMSRQHSSDGNMHGLALPAPPVACTDSEVSATEVSACTGTSHSADEDMAGREERDNGDDQGWHQLHHQAPSPVGGAHSDDSS